MSLLEKNESTLIKECQNGQLENFSILYQTYFNSVYKFIFYKTMNQQTAEDITSDTFMKILTKINTFNPQKSSFKTWIFTIARNTVVDFYRAQKPTTDIEDVWDLDIFETNTDSPKEILDTKISHQKLHKALNKLPAKTREILILRFWQDLSWQEISEITSASQASLKMKTARAIKSLGANFGLFVLIPSLLKF